MAVTVTTSAYVIGNRFSTNPCDVKIICGKYSTIGYGYFVMKSNTISDGCGGYYEVGSEVNENLTTGYTNGVEYIKLLHVQSGSQNIWVSQTAEELIEMCKCVPTNFTVVVDNGDGTYTADMPDGTSVTWTGATGTSFSGVVNDLASLPAAALHNGELWYVINTSAGSIGGTYYSTGTSWITPLALFDSRITNIENNVLKVTYYEIVSGASGTITPPTGTTFNSDEFGNSGNSILSRINGANKPTYESPKTAGGVVVTANLNTTTGAWVASGTYTDTNIALIYSINVKEVDYANLNNFYIVGDPEPIITFKNLVEEISFLDSNTGISAQTYTIILYANYPCTVDEIRAICDAGSATVSLEINGTPITGASLTVTNSINSATASSGNTLNIGDKLTMTVSAPSAFDVLQAVIKTTRL